MKQINDNGASNVIVADGRRASYFASLHSEKGQTTIMAATAAPRGVRAEAEALASRAMAMANEKANLSGAISRRAVATGMERAQAKEFVSSVAARVILVAVDRASGNKSVPAAAKGAAPRPPGHVPAAATETAPRAPTAGDDSSEMTSKQTAMRRDEVREGAKEIAAGAVSLAMTNAAAKGMAKELAFSVMSTASRRAANGAA